MSDPFAGMFAQPAPAQQQPYAGGYPQQPQQQQQPNDNPFAAAYGNQQQPPAPAAAYNMQSQSQRGAMVASTQPTNQWAVSGQGQAPSPTNNHAMGYAQQQQPRPTSQQTQYTSHTNPTIYHSNQLTSPSAQSIASSNYMTPGMNAAQTPQSQATTSMMMTPSGQQQLYSPDTSSQQQQYGNPYASQQQQQQQQQPSSPTAAPPAPPTIKTTDEEDDFFGAFSTAKKNASPHRPPTEFDTDNHESISVLSKSTNASDRRAGSKYSALDDPKFAPKPPKPHGLDKARALAHNPPPGSSPLPDYDLVTHSGYALARISFRTILIKKWKQVFWVTYGVNKLLVFRSSADFEDWISNPYLNKAQRDFLLKLEIDLVGDLGKPNIRGYQVTNQRLKNYNNQMLYQFKIERWMDYGPTIAAAFGSPNEREIFQLRTVFSEMLKRAPKLTSLKSQYLNAPVPGPGMSGSGSKDHASTPHSYAGPAGHGQFNYSSNASTGMLYEQDTVKSSRSYGVLSTGPVERRSMRSMYNHENEAVAGYQPTGRNGFQY